MLFWSCQMLPDWALGYIFSSGCHSLHKHTTRMVYFFLGKHMFARYTMCVHFIYLREVNHFRDMCVSVWAWVTHSSPHRMFSGSENIHWSRSAESGSKSSTSVYVHLHAGVVTASDNMLTHQRLASKWPLPTRGKMGFAAYMQKCAGCHAESDAIPKSGVGCTANYHFT